MTPSGLRGVINDAVAIYFLDPTTAAGFVARWRAGSKFETAKGAFSGSARMRQRRELVWQHTGRRDRKRRVDDMQPLSLPDKARVGTRQGRDSRQESFEASVSHPFGTAGTETAAPPKMGQILPKRGWGL
jgi:hypothetical protein